MSQSGGYDVSVEYVAEELGFPLPLKFPVELRLPTGFDPDEPKTWPRVHGRLEYVGGRLLFMPPCGGSQGTFVLNLGRLIGTWVRANPDYVGGSNEVGMKLGDDRRGADVAVWRTRDRSSLKGFAPGAPLLAVEVEGEEEGDGERALREKARWYLEHGTQIVWLALQSRREIIVITASGESRHKSGELIPEHTELPGLRVSVDEVFYSPIPT